MLDGYKQYMKCEIVAVVVFFSTTNSPLTLEANLTYGSLQHVILWNVALVTSHTALCRACTACILALFSVQSGLVPRPPLFLPSVCIHNNSTRKRKTDWNEAMCTIIHGSGRSTAMRPCAQ